MGKYFGREPRYSQEEAEEQAKQAIEAAVSKGRPPADEWTPLQGRMAEISQELATRTRVDLPPPPPGPSERRAVRQILRPPEPEPEPAPAPAAKKPTAGKASATAKPKAQAQAKPKAQAQAKAAPKKAPSPAAGETATSAREPRPAKRPPVKNAHQLAPENPAASRGGRGRRSGS